MVFQASDYVIWMVFILLETIAFRLASKPEHRSIRAFLALCLLRDFILLTWSCHSKPYWDICWIGNEVEWVALALLAGGMIGKTRPWRLPAFLIAALCFHYAWTDKWPVYAPAEEIFHLERNMAAIILATLLIGALFTFPKSQLRLAGAIGVLAASSAISAQSYLMGNYSPMIATAVWVIGLVVLIADLKAGASRGLLISSRQPLIGKSMSGIAGSLRFRQRKTAPESMLSGESLHLQELSVLPCHTQIQ